MPSRSLLKPKSSTSMIDGAANVLEKRLMWCVANGWFARQHHFPLETRHPWLRLELPNVLACYFRFRMIGISRLEPLREPGPLARSSMEGRAPMPTKNRAELLSMTALEFSHFRFHSEMSIGSLGSVFFESVNDKNVTFCVPDFFPFLLHLTKDLHPKQTPPVPVPVLVQQPT